MGINNIIQVCNWIGIAIKFQQHKTMPSKTVTVLIEHYNVILRNKEAMADSGGTYMDS